MPGLFDCHTHPAIFDPANYQHSFMCTTSAEKTLRALARCRDMLRCGWTSIRIPGDADVGYSAIALQRASNDATHPLYNELPRIQAAAHYLASTGAGGSIREFSAEQADRCCHDGLVVDGPDEIRKAVRQEIAAGATWIKLLISDAMMVQSGNPCSTTFSVDEVNAACDESNARGIPVCCHAHSDVAANRAVEAGNNTFDLSLSLSFRLITNCAKDADRLNTELNLAKQLLRK